MDSIGNFKFLIKKIQWWKAVAAVLFNFHCVVVVAQTIKGTEESVLGVEQEEQGVEHRKRKTNKEQNFCYKTDENNPQSIDSEQSGKTNIYSVSLPSLF